MKRRGPRKDSTKAHSDVVLDNSNRQSTQLIHGAPSGPLSRNQSAWPFDLSATDSLLLDRYIQHFSRTYPAFSGPNNPFLSVLLPLSTQSRVVLDSLLALSAVQSWENESFTMESAMLNFREKALRGCRSLLVQGVKTQDDVIHLLASCVLLLLYEKLAGEGQQNWTPHLQFFAQSLRQHLVLDLCKNSLNISQDVFRANALRFLTALFFYNDLVHSTTLHASTLSDFYLMNNGGSYLDILFPETTTELGRFTFPRLIARLSAGDLTVTDADIATWPGRLDWVPSFALSPAYKSDGNSELLEQCYERRTISELYRVAAMVYRRQRLRQVPSKAIGTDGLESFDIACTESLALQATELLELLPEGSVYETSILWPIGIIAKELTNGSIAPRYSITSRLHSLERRFQMRHFGIVRQHLYKYWSTRDQGLSQKGDECILFG